MTMETESELSVDRQPEYITDLSRMGRTRGLAEFDGLGRVVKNPEPVVGEVYLMWTDAEPATAPTAVATYCGENGFAGMTYIPQPDNEEEPLIMRTSNSYTFLEKTWVKARFEPVVITDEQMEFSVILAEDLNREIAAETQWLSDFSDALNELADTNGWCGTYDDIVREVGLPGREKDYWVDVEANCTLTDNNPSGRLDTTLEEHYGFPFNSSCVEIRGKVTVRVTGITATGDSEAQNAVTREDVVSALDGMFSGDVELDDWEVKDSGEEDD